MQIIGIYKSHPYSKRFLLRIKHEKLFETTDSYDINNFQRNINLQSINLTYKNTHIQSWISKLSAETLTSADNHWNQTTIPNYQLNTKPKIMATQMTNTQQKRIK